MEELLGAPASLGAVGRTLAFSHAAILGLSSQRAKPQASAKKVANFAVDRCTDTISVVALQDWGILYPISLA